MTRSTNPPPLVYACSGCSSVAQMTNHLALRLDREGVAEMSCIAGVGGDVPNLVRTARSGRAILAIDGCPLACARACLARAGVEPDCHVQLHEYGVRKRYHADFDQGEAEQALARVRDIAVALGGRSSWVPAAAD
ncbi:MAG: putative zinc-binding protein [Burkholderiales bacterium]|nr:putative zinc-binding protein [Burkholderiales bacterium]